MKLLDKYFKLQELIYKYFGYKEDWRIYPLNDNTEYFWYLDLEKNRVIYAKNMKDFTTGDYFSSKIYFCRFLEKHIYHAKRYTMILENTRTDHNIFLSIFSNKKELKEIPVTDEYEIEFSCNRINSPTVDKIVKEVFSIYNSSIK